MLTVEQQRFFETFGYIVMPGLVKEDIDWITEEFEMVFRDRGVVHDGTQRSTVVPFIDQRERLCTLLDHPKIEGLISTTAAEIEDLEKYIGSHARFWIDHLHSDVMRQTASPARLVHLRQVMAHEAHLPALSAKARAEMAESARG